MRIFKLITVLSFGVFLLARTNASGFKPFINNIDTHTIIK